MSRGKGSELAIRRAGRAWAGALGAAGSVACGISMILIAAGVGASAAASGMAAMSGTGAGTPHGVLGVLLRIGPWLLVVSVLLVTAAFALTSRPAAAIPALLAGAGLYAGMYRQTSLLVMYASIAAGYTVWIALYLWARGGHRRRAPGNLVVRTGSDRVIGRLRR